jgi:hypothetical protein
MPAHQEQEGAFWASLFCLDCGDPGADKSSCEGKSWGKTEAVFEKFVEEI